MPTSITNRIRVLLIDDHTLVRAGLSILIERQPGLTVIGEAANRADALASAAREQPDIILLDLGGDNSLNFLPELQTAAPAARVILLTDVLDPEVHRRAVRRGAMGLVLKDQATEVLIKAIEKVHAGEVWLERSMMASLLTEISSVRAKDKVDPEAAKIAALTAREREVIALVAEGLRNKQIAERLFISEATVGHHLGSIFDKLGVTNRLELVIYTYRHGLAQPPR